MGGDSGNPIFCKVGNELVLLGAWYTGTPNSVNSIPLSSGSYIGNFPAVTALYDEVNKILGKLNYKLQTVNLSAYKSKDLRVDMQNIDGIVNAADTVTVPTPNAPAPVEPKGFSLSTAATIGYLVWKYL
jgi:nucleoid-associated protein YgaU